MAKIYELAFKIGGSINNSFNNTFKTANKKIHGLNSSINNLEKSKSNIDKFQKLRASTEKTAAKFNIARLNIKRLNKEISSTEKPNKKLIKQLESENKKRDKLEQTLVTQRSKLSGLNRTMIQSGVNTGNLSSENERLARSIYKSRIEQKKFNTILAKQKINKNKRDNHRSRIFDAAGAGAAIIAPVVFPIKKAIDFESSMADVRKTVNFDTPEGFMKFSKMISELPRTAKIPLNQEELAQIAAAGGQLGIVAKELPSFIKSTAKMSIAFDMSADKAGESAAKLSNVYGIPISGINNLGDAVNHLSDNTAAKAHEMVDVLLRIGGTAKNIGLTAVQTSALGNSMIALGKQPEIAGTSISFMLSKLATVDKQGEKFNNALDLMGMSADDLKDNLQNDAQGAILEFLESIEKVEQSDRQGVIVDLFGEEQAKHIGTLVGGLDKYRHSLKLISKQSNYAGSVQKEFENRSKTTANNLKLLSATTTEASIKFGNLLLPYVNKAINGFDYLAQKAVLFIDTYPGITKFIGLSAATAAGIMGVVAAGSAAGYMASFVSGGFLALSKTFMLLKNSLILSKVQLIAVSVWQKVVAVSTGLMTAAQWALNAALSANPIVLIGAAIVGAAVLIYKYWKPISGFFTGMWDSMSKKMKPVLDYFKKMYDRAKSLFSYLKPLISWFSDDEQGKKIAKLPENSNVVDGLQTINHSYDLKNQYGNKPGIDPRIDYENFSRHQIDFNGVNDFDQINKDLAVSHTNNNQKKEVNLNFSPVITIPAGSDKSVIDGVNKSLSESKIIMKDEFEKMVNEEKRINY